MKNSGIQRAINNSSQLMKKDEPSQESKISRQESKPDKFRAKKDEIPFHMRLQAKNSSDKN